MRSIRIGLSLLLALAMAGVCYGASTTYQENVAKKFANPSPVDKVTGSSINQFGTGQTNSQVDNYIYQDEQIDVKPADGTVKVLRTNQKNNINDFVPLLIPIHNAKARELRTIAREITALEGGTAEAFIDPKTKETGIYVVAPRFMLPSLQQTFKALDKPWLNPTDDGTATEVYVAKNRNEIDVNRLAIAATTGDYTASIDPWKNAATFTEDPVQMKAYLKYSTIVDVPISEIFVDAKFIEVNTQNDSKIGLDWIAWKNGPGRDLFEFIFAGVNNNEHFRGASSIFNPLTPFIAPEGAHHETFETEGHQAYGNYNYYITAAYLDFLQIKGKAKVLVSPQIQTVSSRLGQWSSVDPIAAITSVGTNQKTLFNKEDSRELAVPDADDARVSAAKLAAQASVVLNRRQEDLAMLSKSAIVNLVVAEKGAAVAKDLLKSAVMSSGTTTEPEGNSGDLGSWDRFVNFTNHDLQSGVFLDVLPFIGKQSTEMFVNATISNVSGYTPNGAPIISKRSVASEVRTKDGQMLVIGGLKRTEKVKSKNGAPWLSEIPVLGYLFGGETTADRESTVLVTMNTVSSIGSPSKMEITKDMASVMTQVSGPKMPKVPANSFGFDQWLLDPEKLPASKCAE